MDNIKELTNDYKKGNLEHTLKVNYASASKNTDFQKLVTKLKIKDAIAYKYTSKLENTLKELNNCKKCQGLGECSNEVKGCVFYPELINDELDFNFKACKYNKQENSKCTYYNLPLVIKNARMSLVDTSDKRRAPIIKWMKKFYDEYPNNKNLKGLFLDGSFGCGKSYLISALLNELSLKGYSVIMVYYPDFLLDLKSFGNDYQNKIEALKTVDLLLLDDIGAEAVTPWSRDEILGSILQYRMDNVMPTFFTSNYKIDELEIKLSSCKGSNDPISARRIIERIKQLTDELTLVSENRRK